jgi:hypothetical protein
VLSGVVDRGSFFEAVRSTFPLDPPLMSDRSWDALSDSLWEGLHGMGQVSVVIAWPDAVAFCTAAPDGFATAIQVLADVADGLADQQATAGSPLTVSVFVADREDKLEG